MSEKRPMILLVEDDWAVRECLRDVLELEGYMVYTAVDGKDALEGLQSAPVELVILDLMMPVMDGWQFLERLLPNSPPVIVISAAHEVETLRHPSVVAAIRKPADLEDLRKVIAKYCPLTKSTAE